MSSYDCPDIEWSHFAQSVVLNCRGLPLTKQTLSCVNLTCSRGESRAVEVVLFHFIIPAVCHILSCTHTHRTKWNFNLKDSQISLVLYIFIRSVRQQCKKTAPYMEPIHPFWEHACLQCCTFCHPALHCGRCFITHIIWRWHISAVSHGVWALKHRAKWRGNWSQLFSVSLVYAL